MGAIFKFIIFVSGIFFFLSLILGASTMRLILRFLFRGKRKTENKQQHPTQEPISQNERIITYKKKEFETSTAEDVEFEEIKEDDK